METLWSELKTGLSQGFISTVLSVLAALLILFVGLKLIRWLVSHFKKSRAAKRLDPTVLSFLVSVLNIGAILLLAVLIASVVGVSSASIVAVLGSVSLAIGLALQGSLANFAGGVMILLFKPFVIGDYIELKTGETGTVTDISIFYTTLLTVDNRRLVIPNGAVSNASVTNYTAMPQRRVDLEFSLAYDSDAALVKRLILETAAQDPRIQKDPAPFARMTRMDASALVFTFRGWCETGDYWEVYFDLCERVKAAFDANGVAIPFPQMDVHVNAPLKTDEG